MTSVSYFSITVMSLMNSMVLIGSEWGVSEKSDYPLDHFGILSLHFNLLLQFGKIIKIRMFRNG